MLYNFDALDSGSDDPVDEQPQCSSNASSDDRKKAEIAKLEALRDQKRKELLPLTKGISSEDSEHDLQVRELSKQIIKLSRAAEEQRKTATALEQKLKTLPDAPPSPSKVGASDAQNEMIRNFRKQNDSLKTEIQKAKRVLAQEGGCKNRALKIKKLEAMLNDLPRQRDDAVGAPPKTPGGQNVDVQTLRNEIGDLTKENDSLKLKLKGLVSRVSTLEKNGLKERVVANLKRSEANDEMIEKLRPKELRRLQQKKFRDHIGQQSRLAVIIAGLNSELVERNRELNHNAVENNEAGICKEIERLQKRLHLLESSMSCLI